jgi:hypothetical protein
VQVYNKDETKPIAGVLAIPDERLRTIGQELYILAAAQKR